MAVILLSIVGYVVSGAIRRTMEDTLRSQSQTLLTVERAMLERWFKVQESMPLSLANNEQVRHTVAQLLAATAAPIRPGDPPGGTHDERLADMSQELAKELEPGLSAHDFVGYVLVNKQHRVIASSNSESIGQTVAEYEGFLPKVFEGKATVCPPFSSTALVKDERGRLRTGTPTMFVCVPVRDNNFQVVAALALRIRPERDFTSILQLGQLGQTGETYAINKQGLMVSNSRFDEDLVLLGLLPIKRMPPQS